MEAFGLQINSYFHSPQKTWRSTFTRNAVCFLLLSPLAAFPNLKFDSLSPTLSFGLKMEEPGVGNESGASLLSTPLSSIPENSHGDAPSSKVQSQAGKSYAFLESILHSPLSLTRPRT